MIDVKAMSQSIFQKAASEEERTLSVDKRASVVINMLGLINGQAYAQTLNRFFNMGGN